MLQSSASARHRYDKSTTTFNPMERAGRLISKLKIPKEVLEPEALARTAWPVAVGRKIAAHARAVRLVRATLVIECEDSVWQNHLATLSYQIVRNLQSILGPKVVTGLDFRPAVPRRGPQTALAARKEATPVAAARKDEADSIADPVFRHLYKQSRKNQMGLDFEESPAPLEHNDGLLSDGCGSGGIRKAISTPLQKKAASA